MGGPHQTAHAADVQAVGAPGEVAGVDGVGAGIFDFRESDVPQVRDEPSRIERRAKRLAGRRDAGRQPIERDLLRRRQQRAIDP